MNSNISVWWHCELAVAIWYVCKHCTSSVCWTDSGFVFQTVFLRSKRKLFFEVLQNLGHAETFILINVDLVAIFNLNRKLLLIEDLVNSPVNVRRVLCLPVYLEQAADTDNSQFFAPTLICCSNKHYIQESLQSWQNIWYCRILWRKAPCR